MTVSTKLATELNVATSDTFDSVIGSSGASLVRVPVAALQSWASGFATASKPQDYGAVGDGVTDDSSAVSDWIDAIVSGNIVGFVPSGDYLLNSAISKAVSSQRFGIVGAGQHSARFIVPASNTTGALIFASSSRNGEVLFRDFGIITQGQGGIGLQYTQPEGGNQHRRNVTCENVFINGEDDTADYFDTFFDFSGAWRPYLRNCLADGPWFGLGLEDASLRYAADYAYKLDGCYGIDMSHCYGWGAKTLVQAGVYQGAITGVADIGSGLVRLTVSTSHPFQAGTTIIVSGTTSYNGSYTVSAVTSTTIDVTATYVASETGTVYYSTGPEGFMVHHCVFNGCRTGINFVRPAGREPTASIFGTHVNARDNAVILDGIKLPAIRDCSFYNEDTGQEYSGVPHDLFLKNCSEFIISGNVFHFDGNPDRIGVFVESDTAGEGDNGIISGNVFSGEQNYNVWLSGNCTGVIVGPNSYPGTIGTQRVNDVSTSNIIIDGKTETTGTWTPALSFGGAAVGMTYSAQTGTYKIVGGVLHFDLTVTLTAKGTSTGNAEITLPTALPGPLGISANNNSAEFVIYTGMASLTNPCARAISATALRLTSRGASAITNITDANFTNTSSVTISGTLRLT